MSSVPYHRGYHSPWANLASAILASGIRAHDTTFLESDWADTLREICRLDDEMHNKGRILAKPITNGGNDPHETR